MALITIGRTLNQSTDSITAYVHNQCLVSELYDEIVPTYPDPLTEVYEYKLASVHVATVTATYDALGRCTGVKRTA